MNYQIRPIHQPELPLLRDFLYNAIFIPEGAVAPPMEIVDDDSLQVYIRDFGNLPDDRLPGPNPKPKFRICASS